MKHNQSLVLITKGEESRQVLASQLNDLLRGRVQVRSISIDRDFSPAILEGDLIVASSEAIRHDMEPYLKGHPNVIVARRTIDLRSLPLLLKIPPRTKVMLVNDRKDNTNEVISLLYGMGFTDIWFIPFYPGIENIPKVDTAVTTGKSHLVPPEVKNVIDLGHRIIDVTTLTEILIRLDLLDEQAHLLSARYLNQAIEISKRLIQSLEEKQELTQLLATVLNKIQDGVIAIDAAGKTLLFNRVAERFFKISSKEIIGKRLHDFLPQIAAERPLQKLKSEDNLMETYAGRQLIVNRTLLNYDTNKQPEGVLVTFNELGALEKIKRQLKPSPLNSGYVAKYNFSHIQGRSPALKDCLKKAMCFAETNFTVLITGDTGTGKELFAHAIHNSSPRRLNPFVAINCAALPKDLLESELFGYEEGAFTGARKGGRAGLFEQAHGGTMFLDEIGDMPLSLQAKLLRVLEEKEVMRVGAERVIPVDVRVIAATNQDLKKAVEKGAFRSDLYFRLNAFTIKLPALKERPEDIYPLIAYFLKKSSSVKNPKEFFTPQALDSLLNYSWPGNVRELRNVIEYLTIVCQGRKVEVKDLPLDLEKNQIVAPAEPVAAETNAWLEVINELKGTKEFTTEIEILEILNAATKNGQPAGRKYLAAQLQGQGYKLTEDMVRTRLKGLAQKGLIKIGMGRRGTAITPKGRELLAKWQVLSSSEQKRLCNPQFF